jgi:hypothetical protein
MFKRLLAAFALLTLLTGFVTACGGDDDDDDEAADVVEDEGGDEEGGEEAGDEEATEPSGDDPMAVVCSDTGQADDGVITAEEAGEGAAQFEAVTDPPEEIADAIAGAAQYLRDLEAAGEDVAAEDMMLSEHLTAVGEWCSANMP